MTEETTSLASPVKKERKLCGKTVNLKEIHHLSNSNKIVLTFVSGASVVRNEKNLGFQIKVNLKYKCELIHSVETRTPK